MSEIKVNKISPRSGTTVTLGDSGDTFTIPSGATINNQGTATNFGATGSASWTTTVKTGDFTAVAGEGYFVNTTSGEIDVTLPAGSPGAVVAVKDYANTWDTNNCILISNGSEKIGGSTNNATLTAEGLAVTLIYIDAVQGWLITDDGLQSVASTNPYIVATGGTVTESGDYKIHTFTGPGTFCVSIAALSAANNKIDYVVVAGGGGGGGTGCTSGGAGGAGGFRYYANTTTNPQSGNPAAPINNFPSGTEITATAQGYPITVGGAGSAGPDTSGPTVGGTGGVSTFSTVTSSGGGGGHGYKGATPLTGAPGGSGGGGSYGGGGGNGNDPSVSPAQGNNGGAGDNSPQRGGGGGGAMAVGTSASSSCIGSGGAGAGITGFGSSGQVLGCKQYFSGGGGGASDPPSPAGGSGGLGGGATGGKASTGGNGTVNTGGGGGGSQSSPPTPRTGGTGGSGIVILRYKYQ